MRVRSMYCQLFFEIVTSNGLNIFSRLISNLILVNGKTKNLAESYKSPSARTSIWQKKWYQCLRRFFLRIDLIYSILQWNHELWEYIWEYIYCTKGTRLELWLSAFFSIHPAVKTMWVAILHWVIAIMYDALNPIWHFLSWCWFWVVCLRK